MHAVLYHCSDRTIEDIRQYLIDPSHSGTSSAPGKSAGDVGLPLSPMSSVASSPPKKKKTDSLSAAAEGVMGLAAVRLVAGDVMRGGCVLAAAELQSSKEFIRNGDGSFTTAYYVRAVIRYICV